MCSSCESPAHRFSLPSLACDDLQCLKREITVAVGLVTILDTRDAWVTFHVREDRLAGVSVGDVIHARVPALSNRGVTLTVARVASEADYATWRSTSAQGGFDLMTQMGAARAEVASEWSRLWPLASVYLPLAWLAESTRLRAVSENGHWPRH